MEPRNSQESFSHLKYLYQISTVSTFLKWHITNVGRAPAVLNFADIRSGHGPGSLKVGRLHKDKNSVISGLIKSLVLNTSTLAPRDGCSGALQSALC